MPTTSGPSNHRERACLVIEHVGESANATRSGDTRSPGDAHARRRRAAHRLDRLARQRHEGAGSARSRGTLRRRGGRDHVGHCREPEGAAQRTEPCLSPRGCGSAGSGSGARGQAGLTGVDLPRVKVEDRRLAFDGVQPPDAPHRPPQRQQAEVATTCNGEVRAQHRTRRWRDLDKGSRRRAAACACAAGRRGCRTGRGGPGRCWRRTGKPSSTSTSSAHSDCFVTE